jgi:hypothetical protein
VQEHCRVVKVADKQPSNELRIDAAGVEKVKRKRESAAASVLVELSRILEKEAGWNG